MLGFAFVCLACSGESAAETEPEPSRETAPATEREPETEPEPERETEPEPQPEELPTIDAHRLRGPSRSLCGIVRRVMRGDTIDCSTVTLRSGDDNEYPALRVLESLEPEGSFSAVHFVEIAHEAGDFDMGSECALLVQTEAGWFGRQLATCESGGRAQDEASVTLRWGPLGQDGAKRLVVELSYQFGHHAGSYTTVRDDLVCGAREDGHVNCVWFFRGASNERGAMADGDELDPDWSIELSWEDDDLLIVGEVEGVRPDEVRRPNSREVVQLPPAPGRYHIRY